MDIIKYKPQLCFFDQLPYEIVCYIFLFIEKDHDDKLKELNYNIFNIIINEDEYINKRRFYEPINILVDYIFLDYEERMRFAESLNN